MYQTSRVVRSALTTVTLVLVVQVVSAWAQSEATIRGQVVAAADGSALAQAHVSLNALVGESKQVAADPAGRFIFLTVPPREYVLTASFEGFIR
jgi:hypothetical protein